MSIRLLHNRSVPTVGLFVDNQLIFWWVATDFVEDGLIVTPMPGFTNELG